MLRIAHLLYLFYSKVSNVQVVELPVFLEVRQAFQSL
jgi:hypothetical protein